MIEQLEIPKRAFNALYLPYMQCMTRYLLFFGGAGSGKSHFVVQRYIVRLLERSMCNLLVIRYVGDTNRNSTFALFQQVIGKWGLGCYFQVNKSELRISCLLTGNSVLFKGMDDTEKLKSITFARGELTDIWIEEASEIENEQDFNQLDVRLRGGSSSKQIVLSFNPININHWLKKRFFDSKDDSVTVLHSTYKDNAFIDDEYRKLLEGYKESDPYYYDVYCLGQWGVYGKTVFESHSIATRLSMIPKPIKTGYFSYRDTGKELVDILWVDDSSGYISIYYEPEARVPYVIGGDTAGDGSDSFTGQVIHNISCVQAAVLRQQFDEDLYACQMYCLGMHYNKALIAPETNYSTYPTKELQRRCYPKLYVREREDTYTGGLTQSYGFQTTAQTRPVIISELVKAMRGDGISTINDESTLHEMLTFVRNEKGRPEAQNGAHDDLIMGLAIAWHARTQQSMALSSEKIDNSIYTKRPDLLEDWRRADPETRKIMEEQYGKPGTRE